MRCGGGGEVSVHLGSSLGVCSGWIVEWGADVKSDGPKPRPSVTSEL